MSLVAKHFVRASIRRISPRACRIYRQRKCFQYASLAAGIRADKYSQSLQIDLLITKILEISNSNGGNHRSVLPVAGNRLQITSSVACSSLTIGDERLPAAQAGGQGGSS